MHHRSPVLALLACALAIACGGRPAEPDEPRPDVVVSEGSEHRETAPRQSSSSPRDLGRSATFRDLADAARRQDDLRDQESDAGCLIRTGPAGFRLDADLAVAVRPLPPAAEDLDARLEAEPGPVRALTRFGTYGSLPAGLGVVALSTTLPPTRSAALVLFLTDRGLYARRTDRPGGERSASRIDWQLGQIPWDEFDLVVVTAEAAIPLLALVELLERLPATLAGRIALATPLAEGTRLPEAPAVGAASERAELCPDGLPELAESDALGDLGADRIRGALDPLRRAAELCVGTSTGPGAAGGRVAIAVRIDPAGGVAGACVMEDSTGDPALRACLVRAAQDLTFDSPGGYLDFALPLALEPGSAQRQSPVCR